MITIDWGTKVITVPKSFMTVVQSNPIEILNLDLNQFRLTLRELEATVPGMAELRTHIHNTEVLLGGIVYARVIQIINGYTVTFEDGAYAVNLIGANSNVGDVINFNQVSVRSANAAGLISNAAIEYSSFNGGVTIDAVNGTNGTVFPQGTPRAPVKTVAEAVAVAEFRGFDTIFVKGNLTLTTGDDLTSYNVVGDGINSTVLTIEAGANVPDIELSDLTVQGSFDGKAIIRSCNILNITSIEAEIFNCTLKGEVSLSGSGTTYIEESMDGRILEQGLPAINFNNSNHKLAIRDYTGDIVLKNSNQDIPVEVNISTGGRVTLDPTFTAGHVRLTGTLQLVDNSTGAAVIDDTQVIYPEYQQLVSFNEGIHIDVVNGTAGTKFPIGSSQNPVNNLDDAIIIAEKRGIKNITVTGTLVVVGKNLDQYTFRGVEMTAVVVLVANTGNSIKDTTFRDIGITGQINGYFYADKCAILDLQNVGSDEFPSVFADCIIRGDDTTSAISLNNTVTAGQDIHFFNCVSGALDGEIITIDFNGSNSPVGFRGFRGGLEVKNYTGGQSSIFSLSEGGLKLDASNTNGKIIFRGHDLEDNSNGLTVDTSTSSEVKILEVHKLLGLKKGSEVTLTKTGTTVDDINIEITGDRENISIINRT